MKKTIILAWLVTVALAVGQGTRPPTDKLSLLRDVDTTGLTNGQILSWNSGTSKFVFVNPGGGSGLSGGTSGHVVTAASATTIQDSGTALSSLVPTSRTINGHALSSNFSLVPGDLGATTIAGYGITDSITQSSGVVSAPAAIHFAGKLAYATDDHIDRQMQLHYGAGVVTDQTLFTTLTHTGSGTYVRNTNNWLRGTTTNGLVDLTPVSVYNSEDNHHSVTLISPRHFVHYNGLANGTTIRFATNTNTNVERTVIGTASAGGGGHIYVGKLDSDVPNTISFAKVLPVGVTANSQIGRAMAYVSTSDQKVWCAEQGSVNTTNGLTGALKSLYPLRASIFTFLGAPSSSDGGSPYFYVFERELVLAGIGNEDQGSFYSANFNHAAINAAMTTLGGGYQLTDYTPTVLPPRVPIEFQFGAAPNGTASMPEGITLYDANHKPFFDLAGRAFLDVDGNELLTFPTNIDSPANFQATPTVNGQGMALFTDIPTGMSFDADNLGGLHDFAVARTNLGATTVGARIFMLTNPSAISFVKINADNTVVTRTPSQVQTDLSLVPGTNVQAFDTDLTTWAGITPGTGVGTFLATPSGANLASALTTALPFSKGGTAGTSIITAFDGLATKGADIASASTTDLSTATGVFVNVTGTATITSFGTVAAGTRRTIRFTGAGTITYNATSMILPTSASIVRRAGDYAVFESLGSGNWRCLDYYSPDWFKYSAADKLNIGNGSIVLNQNDVAEFLNGFTTTVAIDGHTNNIGSYVDATYGWRWTSSSALFGFDNKGYLGVNDDITPTAGYIGEEKETLVAIGSPVSLTTSTAADIASKSLTAGDWDVEGNVNFKETTSTVTARVAGISTTSATLPTDGSEAYNGVQSVVTTETNSITLPRKRVSLGSPTTVYLVGKATFSAGTCGGFGTITARRVR